MRNLKHVLVGMLIGAFALPWMWVSDPVVVGQTVTVDSTQSPVVVNAVADLASISLNDGSPVLIKTGAEKGLWVYDKDSSATVGASVLNGPGGVGRFLVITNASGSIGDATALTASQIDDDTDISFGVSDDGTAKSLSLAELKKTGVQVVNVKQYGAVGDGVTDDTAAIQDAFDACQSLSISAGNKPYPVVFPPGVYLVSSQVTLPRIQSPGSGVTNPRWLLFGYGAQIKTASDITVFSDSGDLSSHVDYWVPTICGFDFLGSHIWNSSPKTSQVAISLSDSYNAVIRDCSFYQWTKAIHMDFCLQASVESCKFHACSTGIKMVNGGTYQHVRDCRFYMFDPEAIGIDGSGSFQATNVIFEGSICKYPIVAADGGQSNHALIDHMHFECVSGCLRLFKTSLDRDYTFEARSVVTATAEFLLFDCSGSDSHGELLIDGIQGASPGISPWVSTTAYTTGKRVIEYTSVGTGTADAATDRITLSSHGLKDNQLITFTTSGTMPGGLSANTVYYVVDPDTNTFKVRSDSGRYAVVNISSAGTGTLTVRKRGNVYRALSSTTGDTPSSSPLAWDDEGSGAAMIGTQDSIYRMRGTKTTTVYKGWTPDNLWYNHSQWSISGTDGLPNWLEYKGFDGFSNGGFINLEGYSSYSNIPDRDTSPVVGGRQYYRTSNTGATSISSFTVPQGALNTPVMYWQTQPIYVLVNDANTTFVHSSSFRLMGGANYTASSGDVLVFIRASDGSNPIWVQVGGSF